MNRAFARLATLALSLPFAVGALAGAAQAEPVTVTIPGCYGAGIDSAIVCNPTFTAEGASPTVTVIYVKVCAGDCHDVPVQWVDPGLGTARVCYAYTDGAGNPNSGCSNQFLPDTIDIKPVLFDLIGCSASQLICAHE